MRLFHGLAFWLPEKWLRLVRRIWLRSTDRVFLLTSLRALQDRTAFRWDDSWMAMGIHEQSLWVCNRVRIGAFWVRYRSKRPGFHGMRLLWPRRLRNWCTDEPVWKRRIFRFFSQQVGDKKMHEEERKCSLSKGHSWWLTSWRLSLYKVRTPPFKFKLSSSFLRRTTVLPQPRQKLRPQQPQ